MSVLHIDIESRSVLDLRKVGVYTYSEHPTTDIWCAAYAVDDEPVKTWVPGMPCPDDVVGALQGGKWTLVAHNANFERIMWREILTPRYGWPEQNISDWGCTMATGMAMGLPASLEDMSSALGSGEEKDMGGRRLMLQMSRPRVTKGNAVTWWDDDDRKERLLAYCVQDVAVERDIHRELIPLRPLEKKVWQMDQAINDRGVCIDTKSVEIAMSLVEQSKAHLDGNMAEITGGAVQTCNQNAKLTEWIRAQGYDIEGVAKPHVSQALADPMTPGVVVDALNVRQIAAKSSTAKLLKMALMAGREDRARGLAVYHGAITARWAGRGIQVQNITRPTIPSKEVDHVIDTMAVHPFNEFSLLHGDVMLAVSNCLRGMIWAKPGYELVCADFSQIEARVLAWLAGEEAVLEVFRGDGKIYEHSAAGIYGVPVEHVTKDQRFVGKVACLALGYQGGVVAFQKMALNYGVEISDEKATDVRDGWRAANPSIVGMWGVLEQAAIDAVSNPGVVVSENKHISFVKHGATLWCRLPSGRCIAYPHPALIDDMTPWGQEKTSLTYKTVGLSRKFERTSTYGGKLAENITQAVARDLLAEALLRVDADPSLGEIVMHIHDEIVCEAPAGEGDLEKMMDVMKVLPKWAKGLPMGAEGWVGRRFKK